MVIDKQMYNTALMRYRLGTILIWLGVLTWLPFIVLRIAGEKPLLFWYLPFHLFGVIVGARLRSIARKEMGVAPVPKSLLQVMGHGLIIGGIIVWVPYFYLKLIAGQEVEVMNFLPYHLAGILGGIVFLLIHFFISRKNHVSI
jgi:hypothetical protein